MNAVEKERYACECAAAWRQHRQILTREINVEWDTHVSKFAGKVGKSNVRNVYIQRGIIVPMGTR